MLNPSADGPAADAATRTPDQVVEAVLSLILTSLKDDKAEDILSIDLRDKTAFADHMVIASGRSARHVGAICEKLMDRLKTHSGRRPRAEGVENGDWALLDAGDVVVHVFRPEVRAFYQLEKMWAPELSAPLAAGDGAKT